MNAHDLPQRISPTYGLIAYQYKYGRQRLYGNLQTTPLYGLRPLSHVVAKGSGIESLAGIDDGPQTVEQLIYQGFFAAPRYDSETAILHDKKHTSWMALDDVLGQIRDRYDIYKRNMLDIQWSQCYAFNEMARGGWPPSEEQHALYERRMQDLRSEQRDERITFWRDVSRIRERIPESAQQYLSAFRKIELLDDTGGDQP